MPAQSRAGSESELPPILIITAGGLEHGGGIGRMIGYLIAEWRRDPAGPDIEIVDPRGPGSLRLWPGHFLGALRAILRRVDEQPLAYIHVAGRGSSLRKCLLTAFCRLLKLPVLLHLHDYDYEQFCRSLPAPLLGCVRWMFRAAAHIIVLGEDAKRTVVELLGVPGERVSILPNAVPAPATAARRGAGPVEIVFLGQLSRRKGLHDLIEALDRPELRSLPWHATFAGGGPHQKAFERQVAETAVADRIALPGWLDRAATVELLNRADILVLPSYAEGMAMSVLEAMAHGLCIVCTPAGALAEVIEPDVSGLMVAPGSVGQLAEALARAIADPVLRTRLGAGAAERFRTSYDAAGYPSRLTPIILRALRRSATHEGPASASRARRRTGGAL